MRLKKKKSLRSVSRLNGSGKKIPSLGLSDENKHLRSYGLVSFSPSLSSEPGLIPPVTNRPDVFWWPHVDHKSRFVQNFQFTTLASICTVLRVDELLCGQAGLEKEYLQHAPWSPNALEIYANKVTLTDVTTLQNLLVMGNLLEDMFEEDQDTASFVWKDRVCCSLRSNSGCCTRSFPRGAKERLLPGCTTGTILSVNIMIPLWWKHMQAFSPRSSKTWTKVLK